jgi:hypothetical protein
MLLEAGPIPPIDASAFQVTFDQPDFEQMTLDAWSQIDSVMHEMDALVDPLAIFDDALTGDTIMLDLDEVDQINGDNAHLVNLSGIPIGDSFKTEGDNWLTLAVAAAPGEAWAPVPESTPYGTVAQPAPTASYAGVTLLDLTTMSGTDFRTGDFYQLQVKLSTTTGKLADYFAVRVWAELARDQMQQANLELGTTDSTGLVTYKGQWGDSDAGAWSMFLHAVPTTGGDVVSQQYQWTVAASLVKHPGIVQTAVTVQLLNISTGDVNDSSVGDGWRLTVTGPPGAAVYIAPTHDGTPLPEAQLGITGTDGVFTLEGAWSKADAGEWVEHYAVGRFTWPSSLHFVVKTENTAA